VNGKVKLHQSTHKLLVMTHEIGCHADRAEDHSLSVGHGVTSDVDMAGQHHSPTVGHGVTSDVDGLGIPLTHCWAWSHL